MHDGGGRYLEVWARYETTGHIAAMVTGWGRGTVGVAGPHFEAAYDWYRDCRPKNGVPEGDHEWAPCSTLSHETSDNHVLLAAFIARVLTR